MGDDVGNDAGHDVGLAVDDDDALPPDEIEEVSVRDLIGKVVRRREQRDVFRMVPPTLTLTLLVGTDATGAPCSAKYAPIIDTSPEPRLVVTTGVLRERRCRLREDGAVEGAGVGGVGACGKFACSFGLLLQQFCLL